MILLLANYTIWAINHASGLRLNKEANYLRCPTLYIRYTKYKSSQEKNKYLLHPDIYFNPKTKSYVGFIFMYCFQFTQSQ
jgi:hypothetical protein